MKRCLSMPQTMDRCRTLRVHTESPCTSSCVSGQVFQCVPANQRP
jgi:hypothetical protein